MPFGYLVSLGSDETLSAYDSITGSAVFFTTDSNLGAGEWAWTGTDSGVNFYNELETGDYHLATDGNVYFVPDLGTVATLTSAQTPSFPSYSNFNTVDGTAASDTMNNSYVDADGDGINDTADNADLVYGYAGDDTIRSGAGDDTVFGGAGSDELRGGGGADVIHGDGQTSSTEALRWFAEGTDGADLSAGFTQNTGQMNVSVSFNNDGNNNPDYQVETSDQIYTPSGDPQSDHSSLYLFGNGDGATSTTTIEFDTNDQSDMTDEVENVTFRINDVDWASGNHRDVVTVNAFDANGDPVTVVLTPTSTVSGEDSVSGNTVTAGDLSDGPGDATGSVLVEIAGPVQSIEIIYENDLGGTQAIWVSDVYFDTIPAEGGNDSLYGGGGADQLIGGDGDDALRGGAGSDTMQGGTGDDYLRGGTGADVAEGGDGADSFDVSEGDTVTGGAGDDVFRLVDLAESGSAGITLVGGEDDETIGDTLDFNGLIDRSTLNLTTNTTGELAGTVEMLDGSLVTFSNIENIICFTPGTMIRTPYGDRAIETLRPGDLILTKDSGPQPIRWVGGRTVSALGHLAPVTLDPSMFGDAHGPLLVSPQHRIVLEGARAQLLFGSREVFTPAKHLIKCGLAHQHATDSVHYMHLMMSQHEVIYANGLPTESFFPGDEAFECLTAADRAALFQEFPELRSGTGAFNSTARPCIRAHEAALMVA